MAEIKITQLNAEQPEEKIIDLKAETEKGNSAAVSAFTTLRGGIRIIVWF